MRAFWDAVGHEASPRRMRVVSIAVSMALLLGGCVRLRELRALRTPDGIPGASVSAAYGAPLEPRGVSYDEGRQVHMGAMTVGPHFQGAGVRTAGEQTPQWWGRDESELDDPNPDEGERPHLTGPLLLPSQGTQSNRPSSSQPQDADRQDRSAPDQVDESVGPGEGDDLDPDDRP